VLDPGAVINTSNWLELDLAAQHATWHTPEPVDEAGFLSRPHHRERQHRHDIAPRVGITREFG